MMMFIVPTIAASTQSATLVRFHLTGFVLHASLAQYLLESMWILVWVLFYDAESLWFFQVTVASCVCLAAKIWCIRKYDITSPDLHEEVEKNLQP